MHYDRRPVPAWWPCEHAGVASISLLGAAALAFSLVTTGCQTRQTIFEGAPAPGDVELPSEQLSPERPQEREGLLVQPALHHTVRPEKREVTQELVQQLRLPEGFRIDVFARDLEQPRGMVVAPNGNLYVAEREAGRVTLLRDSNGDGRADQRRVVATGLREGLRGVHDLAVRENRMYMVTETELYVADIQADGSLGERRLITDAIPAGGQHPNRTIEFSPQGELFLSIGSTCNACVEPMDEHATILRVNEQNGELTVFAEGLRNTIGFAWHPQSRQLWGLDHNSDERADNWPPEELNRIVEGRNYGWPFCGGNREVDWIIPAEPEDMTRTQFCSRSEPPVLTYTAHGAPMQMVFYTGTMFPGEYRHDAFATMRGSWNRNPPSGYEVVRIQFDQQGTPTRIEPFATGWLLEGGRAHFGRLMGLAQGGDGSLLVGDDENGVIYRITHGR